MATTTTLPVRTVRSHGKENPNNMKRQLNTKPSRTMTYPLQNQRSDTNGAPKRKSVKHGEPFDPDDLTRRLQAYLVEQKLRAERRKAAKALQLQTAQPQVPGPLQPTEYHHVPTVAASAFERTTSPEAMRQSHKLSAPAIKAHLDSLALDESITNLPPQSLARTQAMDQAIIARDFLRTKGQYQWGDSVMEDAAEVDEYRDIYRAPQRTFEGEFSTSAGRKASHSRLSGIQARERPLSMGDMLSSEDERTLKSSRRKSIKPLTGLDTRNDWAQNDDAVEKESKNTKEKEKDVPLIKKKPSSWILLGKRSPKVDKFAPLKSPSIPEESGSPPSDGSGTAIKKAGFLARFKRHPS